MVPKQSVVRKGLQMLRDCSDLGIEEVSLYGFTQDNTKRPREQRIAFAGACVAFVEAALKYDIALLCRGNIGDVASDRSSLAATAA